MCLRLLPLPQVTQEAGRVRVLFMSIPQRTNVITSNLITSFFVSLGLPWLRSSSRSCRSPLSGRGSWTFSEFLTFIVNFLHNFPATHKNALSRVVLLVCVCDGDLSPLLEGVFIRKGVWKRSIKAPSSPFLAFQPGRVRERAHETTPTHAIAGPLARSYRTTAEFALDI